MEILDWINLGASFGDSSQAGRPKLIDTWGTSRLDENAWELGRAALESIRLGIPTVTDGQPLKAEQALRAAVDFFDQDLRPTSFEMLADLINAGLEVRDEDGRRFTSSEFAELGRSKPWTWAAITLSNAMSSLSKQLGGTLPVTTPSRSAIKGQWRGLVKRPCWQPQRCTWVGPTGFPRFLALLPLTGLAAWWMLRRQRRQRHAPEPFFGRAP